MNGWKEIVFSCALGLAALTVFAFSQDKAQTVKRDETQEEPVAVNEAESEVASLSLNWGLADIHAPEAWKHHRGSRNVVVAVIDTGCDVHHPELTSNIWFNPGESGIDESGIPKAHNGIDDDDNGFVDDVHGWNFAADNGDLEDNHGHGTHIAGIIGARKVDGVMSAGVAPQVSLMILKYYDTEASGKANLDHTVAAIRYAVRMGADIINYSGGGVVRSREEEEALRWASEQGVLVVAAAGNEGSNSDFYHFYPADYELPNILSVAALDRNDKILSLSNYGLHTVDLAAPGKNIYSTLPGGLYGYMTGTSQATAFVTGVAALLMANDPKMRDPATLIDHLLNHSRKRVDLTAKLRSGSVLDAEEALASSDLNLSQVSTRRPSEVSRSF